VPAFYCVCIFAAIATTLANTGVIWVDSHILGYYTFAVVFGDFLVRLFTGIVTARRCRHAGDAGGGGLPQGRLRTWLRRGALMKIQYGGFNKRHE
jgi:hypothetical protein